MNLGKIGKKLKFSVKIITEIISEYCDQQIIVMSLVCATSYVDEPKKIIAIVKVYSADYQLLELC